MFEDVIDRVSDELNDYKFSRIAALTVFAHHKPRIFEQGRNSSGAGIGFYKSDPYRKKRIAKGREVGFVNLSMTEQMKRDYQPSKEGIVGFGFSNQHNLDKANWNEDRYGDVFELTTEEEEMYLETLSNLLFP